MVDVHNQVEVYGRLALVTVREAGERHVRGPVPAPTSLD